MEGGKKVCFARFQKGLKKTHEHYCLRQRVEGFMLFHSQFAKCHGEGGSLICKPDSQDTRNPVPPSPPWQLGITKKADSWASH